MPTKHPIDFQEKAALPRGSTNADYPYSIKAEHLMKNFVYAALDFPDEMIEKFAGEGGHQQRRLRAPGSGTYVLGAVNGRIQWIETEACEDTSE